MYKLKMYYAKQEESCGIKKEKKKADAQCRMGPTSQE
jgi:hypothetical protein